MTRQDVALRGRGCLDSPLDRQRRLVEMKLSKQIVASVLCVAILNLSSPLVANAEIIGTLQAVENQSRSADLATVNAALAREQVRTQFESMGVDPSQVEARVASLTNGELHTLAGQMNALP